MKLNDGISKSPDSVWRKGLNGVPRKGQKRQDMSWEEFLMQNRIGNEFLFFSVSQNA